MTKPDKLHENSPKPQEASEPEQKDLLEDHAVSEEIHPRLTLLESGQSPGEVLKIAREKKGLSLDEVSSRTKINIHQLRALENGDRSKFPPDTFARAFIKSYCKLVSLEAGPILAAYELDQAGFGGMGATGSTARPENISASMPSSSRRLSSLNFDRRGGNKRVSLFVALAAAALLIGFYLPEFLSSSEPDEVVIPPEISSAIAPDQGQAEGREVPLAPSIAISEDGVVREQVLLPGLSAEPDNVAPVADPELAAASSVFPSLQSPANQASSSAVGNESKEGISEKVGNQAPTNQPAVVQSTNQPAAETKPALSADQLPLSKGEARLRFSFDKESWVTVRDANGKVLLSALNKGGNQETVQGLPPFQLIIGNADSVSLELNGSEVDLAPHVRGDNVARFVLK